MVFTTTSVSPSISLSPPLLLLPMLFFLGNVHAVGKKLPEPASIPHCQRVRAENTSGDWRQSDWTRNKVDNVWENEVGHACDTGFSWDSFPVRIMSLVISIRIFSKVFGHFFSA